MQEENTDGRNRIGVRSYFVRERNALLVRGQFGPVYEDYFLHLLQHGIRNDPAHDALVKDALAAIALHLCSRPRREVTAWTINFQNPLVNIFATGSSARRQIVARALDEEVRQDARGLFVSQVSTDGGKPRQSTVDFEGADVFRAVEQFYRDSEQRTCRFFHFAEEDIVMVSAQPDCDIDWLLELDDGKIRNLDQRESLRLLEEREYAFDCGCTIDKILPVLSSMSRESIDGLFGDDNAAIVTCPRCNAVFRVERGDLA